MSRSAVTVEELLSLLPDLDDLEVFRLRLVSTAVPDPGKAWDSSLAYSTFDRRIVTPEAAERALEEAEESLREYIAELHQGLLPVLRSLFAGETAAAAHQLVALGESLEQSGRIQGAGKCYRAALAVSLPLPDKGPQVLALRRIGRVALTVGAFQEAVSYYERSADLARDAGDLPGEVIARTGLGNVRMWQGRWTEADAAYHAALQLADSAPPGSLDLERGFIYNNLGNLTTRQGRLDESEMWLDRALRQWEATPSHGDLAGCRFNLAHLREAQERWDEARQEYEAVLALPIPLAVRSMVATDLAEWWLHEGHVTQAEEWGRVAEEHAIASRSPYHLGHMYRGRGNIARARGDADGFTFFEKALEIAREKDYSFLEAETLLDYAMLRADNGGAEEAIAYLERARDIFRHLGAVGQLERTERALAELAARIAAEVAAAVALDDEPVLDEEPPLAAAGD